MVNYLILNLKRQKMRILIVGFAAFVIWCVFSAWMYNDNLLPVLNAPEPVAALPEKTDVVADSLAKIYAAMPKELSIPFEFNKAQFKSDQQTDSRIAEFKSWLEKYPSSKLYVTGHSDLVGTEKYNYELGLKRATVVGDYIKGNGIESKRILVESKGETEPAGDYLTAEGRAMNRRTEVKLKLQ
jgi:outer membrane protein OmpA-like peptidoglycan-associated protein